MTNLAIPPKSYGAIAPIFRGPFLEKVARGAHRSTISELARHYGSPASPPALLRDWFDFFYDLLFSRYRCEYVYKNAIANNIFLSRHCLHDSCMTGELRSGSSRADVAILNGTSTVYEIKSEFDSFDRLHSQLTDYRKIFDCIYIVTTEQRSDLVTGTWSDVGVITLRRNGALSVIRKAPSNKTRTDPATIFDCMRQAEYSRAILDHFGHLPQVPNSQLYREAKKMFCSLDPAAAHDLMVRQIKARGKKKPLADLINSAPTSLKHACLNFTKPHALAKALTTKLREPL